MFEEIGEFLTGIGKGISDFVSNVKSSASNQLDNLLLNVDRLKHIVTSRIDEILNRITTIDKTVFSAVDTLTKSMETVFGNINASIGTYVESLSKQMNSMHKNIVSNLSLAVESLEKLVLDFGKSIEKNMKSAFNTLYNNIKQLDEHIKQSAEGLISSMQSAIFTIAKIIDFHFSVLIEQLSRGFESLKILAKEFIDGLEKAVSDLVNPVLLALREIKASIDKTFEFNPELIANAMLEIQQLIAQKTREKVLAFIMQGEKT